MLRILPSVADELWDLIVSEAYRPLLGSNSSSGESKFAWEGGAWATAVPNFDFSWRSVKTSWLLQVAPTSNSKCITFPRKASQSQIGDPDCETTAANVDGEREGGVDFFFLLIFFLFCAIVDGVPASMDLMVANMALSLPWRQSQVWLRGSRGSRGSQEHSRYAVSPFGCLGMPCLAPAPTPVWESLAPLWRFL